MKTIVYSPGEPSGIGPDLIIQLCNSSFWKEVGIPIICIADPKLIEDRAKLINKKIRIDLLEEINNCKKNTIKLMGKIYRLSAHLAPFLAGTLHYIKEYEC